MDGATFVKSGEAAEVLEATDASLDVVAMLVEPDIVQDGDLVGGITFVLTKRVEVCDDELRIM